ncbi:NUMOD4 domain-containing protein [Paenibacillus sp. NPDC093718]|uniref:NUMOD4 domain-containing protein n=1 Tax=Paenibacillus sp. NPDC093718 TaxID=3390601 RepID=UPI003D05769A
MTEQWKAITGFEGLYEVSNFGNVRSIDRTTHHSDGKVTKNKGRVLKLGTDKKGYRAVYMTKNSKKKTAKVHRLVADAFVPNPNRLPLVNHKDENKANNHFENLEWCDNRYNVVYGTGIKRGLETATRKKNKTRRRAVVGIHIDTGERLVFSSTMDAQREGGFNASQIIRCCGGHNFSHRGYVWAYIN